MAKAKRMHMKRLMFYAARSVLSKKSQHESFRYLLEYDCWPPPIFMILISIVQIAIYIYYALESDVNFSAFGPVPIDSVGFFTNFKFKHKFIDFHFESAQENSNMAFFDLHVSLN